MTAEVIPFDVHCLEGRRPRPARLGLRLDVLVEALCRQVTAETLSPTAVTFVCEAVEVDHLRSLEVSRMIVRVLADFVSAPGAQAVVLRLMQAPGGLDLSIWGQGMTRVPAASRSRVTRCSRRLQATAGFRETSAGSGVSVTLRPADDGTGAERAHR